MMNQIDDTNIAGRDDRRFDLLVDGELGEEDRGALLRQLDREPGGWRRCALAFLEAQAWKRDLPALMDSPGESPDRLQPRRRWWWSRHAGTAAGHGRQLPVALALGMSVGGMTTAKRARPTAATALKPPQPAAGQSLADGHGGRQGQRAGRAANLPGAGHPSRSARPGLAAAFPSRFPPTCSRRWSRAATRSNSGGSCSPWK